MAEVSGGRIVWHLDVDDKGFAAKMAAAQAATGQFARGAQGHLGQVEGSTSRLGAVAMAFAKTAAIAVAAGIGAWGVASIKSAAAMQQNRVAFETMLGSGAKAAAMLKEIEAFALKTPFNLPQVVEGAKSLLAYGISAEKIIPTFNALGNIAAGVGKDKLPQLTLAFGQVRAAGRLTGQELRQFTEAGVPLLEVLGQQMGKSTAEIKKMVEAGEIGFPQVERALFSMSEEGGRFQNLMERQSQTLSGAWSNFIDTLGKVGRAFVGMSSTGEVRAGSLFDTLSKGLSAVTTFLVANEGKIIAFGNMLQDKFGQALAAIGEGFRMLLPLLTQVWNFIVSMFKPAWDQLQQALAQASPWLKDMAITIGGALLFALVAVIAVVGLFIVGLIRMATATIQTFTAVYNAVVGYLSGVIENIRSTIGFIVNIFNAGWNLARAIVVGAINGIVATVATIVRIVGVVAGAVAGVAGAMRGGFQNAYNAVAGFIGSFINLGRDIVMGVVRGILSAAGQIGDTLRNIAKGALEAAKAAIQGHSPSRLFAEEIGKPISQGIAVGIMEGAAEINSALSSVLGTPNLSTAGVDVGNADIAGTASVTINAKQLTESDIAMAANRARFQQGLALR